MSRYEMPIPEVQVLRTKGLYLVLPPLKTYGVWSHPIALIRVWGANGVQYTVCDEVDGNPLVLQVIGQCKVIATRYSNDSQDLSVNGYNCTMRSGKVICGVAN